MRLLALIASITLAAPLAAQDFMSAAEFDEYTQGKTLYFSSSGQAYGAEIYHSDRRVSWSFLDGECKEGSWYERGEQICFLYEGDQNPQCWTFRRSGTGLIARFENDPNALELYEASEVGKEMICLGPKVGA